MVREMPSLPRTVISEGELAVTVPARLVPSRMETVACGCPVAVAAFLFPQEQSNNVRATWAKIICLIVTRMLRAKIRVKLGLFATPFSTPLDARRALCYPGITKGERQ